MLQVTYVSPGSTDIRRKQYDYLEKPSYPITVTTPKRISAPLPRSRYYIPVTATSINKFYFNNKDKRNSPKGVAKFVEKKNGYADKNDKKFIGYGSGYEVPLHPRHPVTSNHRKTFPSNFFSARHPQQLIPYDINLHSSSHSLDSYTVPQNEAHFGRAPYVLYEEPVYLDEYYVE